ncbi:FtsX-like permease family protein [Streptomyces sp. 1114.5]|uniref:ABC transporter permease n=1 Tax=Streptomyces sp. 1114.5 TaxID=1938830 RepID=UPI000EB13051|nr:FtsX-like permease family protein [Streptomyces sp. 1114.5]RKT19773.1 FtsX-like permease family protein [Streptomyces sp. 1114.5]
MLGFVVRRLRGRLPLAAAVLLTVLIATAVLTALVTFNSGVGQAGLRQALQGPGHLRTTVVVTAEHGADQREKDEAALAAYRQKLFGELPVRTDSLLRSRSYGLPVAGTTGTAGTAGTEGTAARATGDKADLTVLADVDRGRTRLVAGAWPAAVAGPVRSAAPQVAVPQAVLPRLGLTGQALPADVPLVDRLDGKPLTVRVTGVYQALDPFDPYWRIDPVGGHEVETGGFTTYGPMMVDQSAFSTGGLTQSSRGWLLDADFATVDQATAQALGNRVQALTDDARKTASLGVNTELSDVIKELTAGMVVARSTLLIGALQLAVLAAAALLLVVRLIAARQERENELLAARGASGTRLGGFTALELLLLAAPAAVFAPLLTPTLVHVLGGLGRAHRVTLDTGIGWTLWPVALVCALASVVLAAVPSLLRGAGAALRRRTGRRQALVSGVARNGGDLAVLVLAVLAYQQLDQYGGGLSADSSGELGIDPLLVATPTLALCAGTLIVLRLLPLAAVLGSRVAARGRGLGPAMVGWQLARQPARANGPVLLLVLAVATGVLALGQHATWTASQRDRASFDTAGGLRISAANSPLMGQGGRYGALPGGDRLLQVVRWEQALPGGTGQMLATDTTALADRVPVREDLLAGKTRQELFAPLAAPPSPAAPAAPAAPVAPAAEGAQTEVPLPGHPLRIDADLSIRQEFDAQQVVIGGRSLRQSPPEVTLLLRDRFGYIHKAPFAGLPISGDLLASASLSDLTGAPAGSAATPLSVVGATVSFSDRAAGELTIHRLAVSDTADGAAAPVAVPAGLSWKAAALPRPTNGKPTAVVAPGPAQDDRLLSVSYVFADGTGESLRTVVGPAGPSVAAAPSILSGVATRGYLAMVGASVGDTIRVPVSGTTLSVKITGVVEAVPVAGRDALVIDLATTARLLAEDGRSLSGRAEWWLPASGPGDRTPAEAAAALRSAPGGQDVQVYDEASERLLGDPVGAAPQSALMAIAVATAVLAAIGFGAAVAGSARQRTQDSALLLALGAPRRVVRRATTAEYGLLIGLASVVGVVLGALLVHLIVPFMVLTSAARRPLPEAVIRLPVGQVLLLTLAIAVVPLLSAFLIGRRGRNVASRLRLVEEM